MATKFCPGVIDYTLRSIKTESYLYLLEQLNTFYNVIYMGQKELKDDISEDVGELNLREWAAVIKASDYFVGCDSCGQHLAKAVGTNASVFISGTHEKNISYPEHFHIIKRNLEFTPSPYRLSQFESDLANRLNEPMINFTRDEINSSYYGMIPRIEKRKQKKNFLDPENF
jgi:ADP-heptose:LPS heptosyltransferase